MRIGVPKEIKDNEYRVGMTPPSVRELTHHGHEVIVETGAGLGIGMDDGAYKAAGAIIAVAKAEVFASAQMIVKVKEPQQSEFPMLREGQILFTYLHLAPDPGQALALLKAKVVAIAYETVTGKHGRLPLLAPMSEVAGRMSIQAGASCLEKEHGGAGILLGGAPGVEAAKVVILGGGVVGTNAARMAMGMEAHVTVIDKSLERLRELDLRFGSKINALYGTVDAIERQITGADLVIGAVLAPGAAAPRLVSRELVARMRQGSVIVDVSIDQGGCFETSRPTTHTKPTYIEEGVVHYCVTNMPGAVARTSTFALNNATLPFICALADKGYQKAMLDDPCLMAGLNAHHGRITHEAVAMALGYDYLPPQKILNE